MANTRSPLQYKGVRAIRPPDLTIAERGPAVTDTAYLPGQLWLDKANLASFQYSGTDWISLGTGAIGGVVSLTGNSGGAVAPVGGNISILGGSGVSVVGTAGTLTISLTGGGVAIDSFVPGAGTNPVVPSVLGVVTMAGTANQITTTGGLNSLTFSVPAAFIAPGSIASTTTITAGTSITATLGAITATNGNLVLGTAGNKILSTSVASTTAAGANSFGKVTLVGGSAVVATTSVLTASIIMLTTQALGTVATPKSIAVTARTNATSFTISSEDGTDTSSIGWMIIN